MFIAGVRDICLFFCMICMIFSLTLLGAKILLCGAQQAKENIHQLQYTVCVAYDADPHMHSAASSSN